MKYQIIVDDQVFNVEIVDLHERPIRVFVDGECFEIWPEGPQLHPSVKPKHQPVARAVPIKPANTGSGQTQSPDNSEERDQIKAPIPGVVLSIAVRAGDTVQKGQVLCVLEAMKMKNMIRSVRDGVIAQVHVNPGQSVFHSELLMEYEPQNSNSH